MKDTQRIQTMSMEQLREEVSLLIKSQRQSQAAVASISKLIPYIWALIGGAFLVGGWLATLEFRQHAFSEAHDRADIDLSTLKAWQIKTESNRFTVNDANTMTNNLTSSIIALDKRLQRTEDSNMMIKETLQRIERKLP